MARASKAPTKRAAASKKTKKPTLKLSRWQNPRIVLFMVAFAAVGVFALLQINANPTLPEYSDDMVAGYINVTPTIISQDETGNLAYEMYSASAYVQVDGTIVCDPGGASSTVNTGTLSKGEVKKLQKDIRATGFTDLADEIGADSQDAFVNMEGLVLAEGTEAKGTAVYANAKKPTSFSKAQDTLQRLCAKATRTAERTAVKAPREPKIKKTDKKSAFNNLTSSLFPKASACCNPGVTEDQNFEYLHLVEINKWRKANGRRELPHDQCMGDKATMHSNWMAYYNKFEHSTILAKDADSCRRGWWKLGENIGRGYDNTGLINAFKGSASHNRNMLDTAWTQIGVGAVWVPEGTYKKYYVTQRYARY